MKIRLLLVFMFLSCAIYAQHSLQGQVTDAQTNEPIVGAVIYLHDLKRGGITNAQGNYLIDNLPKGKFIIESKLIGYGSKVETILIEGKTELNFLLSSVATELQEVVVTGISHSTEIKSNPISVSTLDLNTLTENAATNIIDNIAKQPGINQISTGAAIAKPVIRGLGFNRIITLYDGIRQEGQQWGDEHGIEIDEFSVERVEIIKGPGSLMYGSDGIGGVLHFLSAEPVQEGSVTGRFLSNYQINNGLYGNSIQNSGNLNGLYWSARASFKNAKAYSNAYDGKVFNSGFNETNWDALAGKSGRWGYSQFGVSNFSQHVGLTEGDRDSDGKFTREVNENGNVIEATVPSHELNTYRLFVPQQKVNHFRVNNTSNVFFGESRLQSNIGYQRNIRKEFGDVLDTEEPELHFNLGTLTYTIVYFFPEFTGWSVSVGTGGINQRNKNKGNEFLIPEYTLSDWGAFTFFKKHFAKLTLAGGLRYDQRRIQIDALFLDDNGNPTDDTNANKKFTADDLSFSNYSASAGITYQFSHALNMKFNLSRGYRAPNISELASNGQHEGSLRYEYGNYNLSPETSFQQDLSIALNGDHISAELSVFRSTIHNYIYSKKLLSSGGGDSIPDPENPSPAYQYTQGQANLYGGELTVDFHPHPLDWLHIEHSLSLVRGESDNAAERFLPFMPAPRYVGEIRGAFAKVLTSFTKVYLKVEYDYTWRQDRVLEINDTETPTPSYAIWNLGFGGHVNSQKSELFAIYFAVNNMFDKAYQSHLSWLKYAAENQASGRTGVYNMGRNVSIKVVVPLTFRKAK